MKAVRFVLSLALLAALAACSSGPAANTPGGPLPTSTPLPPGYPAPGEPVATAYPAPGDATRLPAEAVLITYRDSEIIPAETTIKVGTAVVFVSEGGPHQPYNLTPPNAFEAPTPLEAGATFSFVFSEPGTVTLRCRLNPGLQATLNVAP